MGPTSRLQIKVGTRDVPFLRDPTVILIDQFKEIFTYADAGAREADEADAFIDLLLHARDARESRIFVVLTMRTDFLGNCVRFLDLPEAINRSLYLTPRLTRDQLAQAMSGPARTCGGDLDPVHVNCCTTSGSRSNPFRLSKNIKTCQRLFRRAAEKKSGG